MLHVVPLTLAHRPWVQQNLAGSAFGLTRSGRALTLHQLPGVVAIREGRPVGYALYSVDRAGWDITPEGRVESRPAGSGSQHPCWLASPGAHRYRSECCLVSMWPQPHAVLLQGLLREACHQACWRIYALVPGARAKELLALGFGKVALYPAQSDREELTEMDYLVDQSAAHGPFRVSM